MGYVIPGSHVSGDSGHITDHNNIAADLILLATYVPGGLTGATAAARFAGGTVSGAPTLGTFAAGDFVIDQSGEIWVCTAAGTPGTWAGISGGGGGSGFANPMTTAGDLITGGTAGAAQRLAIGTSDQALIVSGGAAAWGTVPFGGGGTGQTSQQAALDAIAGAVTASEVLAGNGTHVTLRALAAADLPAATTSAQGAVQLDGTAADIAALGTQAAGSTGKAADAGHVHPTTGVAKTANNLSDLASASTARTNLGLGSAAVAAVDTTAADIAAPGAQTAGSTGKVADAGHVHPASFTATAYLAPKVVSLTDAATIAVDASLGNVYRVTLAGNRTLGNPSNLVDGWPFWLEVTQDATGSRLLTLGTGYETATGLAMPTLSTGAGDMDVLGFRYNAVKGKMLLVGYVIGYA